MHFHHYTLLALRTALLERFKGQQVYRCFSQNKNELIIAWEDGVWRIGCQTPLTYLVPQDDYAKARKNVVELFPEASGLKLTDIEIVPQERILIVQLEKGFNWVVKMHGIQANVIWRQEEKVQALFRHKQEQDWDFEVKPGKLDESLLAEVEVQSEADALSVLREVSPIYEKQFARRWWELLQEKHSPLEAYQRLLSEAKDGCFYLTREKTRIRFGLFANPAEQLISVKGVVEALQLFLKLHFQYDTYRRQYSQIEKSLKKPVRKFEKILTSYRENLHHLKHDRDPEEIGHILMANLHQMKGGVKKVELEDFYQGGTVQIKLDPQKSPQENAAKYYEKHKQRKAKAAYLEDQLTDIEAKWLEAHLALERFQELPAPMALAWGKEGFQIAEIKALRAMVREQKEVQAEEAKQRFPYRTFQREGYQIFVGRNARNNDELSFRFAGKNDLWLHAKDVSGSHVVIRHRAGREVPPNVLEYAAQLAAYYSKRKTDTVVPVIYTPRKYIRKRKGDPAGLVVVDREKVIMVEPIR
ncbi:MAG: NFACT RNA binding domain-containing protein [Bacteroidota bacterium]